MRYAVGEAPWLHVNDNNSQMQFIRISGGEVVLSRPCIAALNGRAHRVRCRDHASDNASVNLDGPCCAGFQNCSENISDNNRIGEGALL